MSSYFIQALCLVAIVISIFLGNKFNRNVGAIALAFSYIINNFFMKESVNTIIGYWPISVTFMLICIGYFYGFANNNGTMEILAGKIIYPFRKSACFFPFIFFFMAGALNALGCSPLAVIVIMGVLIPKISSAANVKPALLSAAVILGGGLGFSLPWCITGVLVRGILTEFFGEAQAVMFSTSIYYALFLTWTIVFILLYVLFKGYKAKDFDMQKPERFNEKQRLTMIILLIYLALLIIPGAIEYIYPNLVSGFLLSCCDVRGLALIGGVFCTFLNLADEKKVIADISWGVIIMISGISTLLELAVSSGVVESVLGILSNNIPVWLAFAVISLTSSVISGFSDSFSTFTVMLPFLISFAAKMESSSISHLLIASFLGAYVADVSPFSTAGAIMISGVNEAIGQKNMFNGLLIIMFVAVISVMILSAFGFYNIF